MKGWGKIGVVVFEPHIKNDKLMTLKANLIKSRNVNEVGCREAGGVWEETVLGGSCNIPVSKIGDLSIQNMVFGRFFSDLTSPTTQVATKEGMVTKKGKARLQFDCGEGTEELFIGVSKSADGLKNMDIACFKPPEEMKGADIQVFTPKGMMGSFRDIDKLRGMT